MSDDPRFFSSARERALWAWALAAVVAIWTSLGPAAALAGALRERNLLRLALGVVVFFLVGAVARRWIMRRPRLADVGVAVAVALAYLLVGARMASWEERTHLVEYGVVAAIIHMALLERARNGRTVRGPAALAIGATAVLGLVDEGIQWMLPGRVFDPRDVFFNAFAGFMVVAARLALAPQRRPSWRVWFLWLMASALGWSEGMYLGWTGGGDPMMLRSVPADLAGGVTGLALGGLLLCVLQWLVLRSHLRDAGRWVLAGVVAMAVSSAGILGAGSGMPEVAWFASVWTLGLLMGLLQWLVLRREIDGAGWWVVASPIAWAVGLPLGEMVGPLGHGAAYGAITGAALVVLLRRRREILP